MGTARPVIKEGWNDGEFYCTYAVKGRVMAQAVWKQTLTGKMWIAFDNREVLTTGEAPKLLDACETLQDAKKACELGVS
jgi:hypothetical protein